MAAKPSSIFIREFRDHVSVTGRPETFPGIIMEKVSRDEPFDKLAKFDIDPQKRGDATWADCPMCRRNQYLSGQLIYLPRLQKTTAIGHCCAANENQVEADKVFEARQKRLREEDYLLDNLSKTGSCIAAIDKLLPTAEEVLRLYRELRGSRSGIFGLLCGIYKPNGRLYITEDIQSTSVPDGPAGYGGRASKTRDIEFGIMAGKPLFQRQFDPVVQLFALKQRFLAIPLAPDEDAVLKIVSDMSDAERSAAYKAMQSGKTEFDAIRLKLEEAAAFFESGNLLLLKQWADHPANTTGMSVGITPDQGGIHVASVRLWHRNSTGPTSFVTLKASSVLAGHSVNWPIADA